MEGISSGKLPVLEDDMFTVFSSEFCLFEDTSSSQFPLELISHKKENASFASQIADLLAFVTQRSIKKANYESELVRVTPLLQSIEQRVEETKNKA
ncbi:hypothetical protein LWI28_010118 [Acer negundo]|uniref:Uncharacterized protein n=1 Tax=Acer negundo TaxID=4023 RepID=A0AAD5J432_ACENE|nr:hypothetical protein LWI28_010118 [Acer negundo]